MRSPSPRVGAWSGILGAAILLLVAPFHAAAYFATEAGSTELMPHQVAGGAAVRGAAPSLYDGDPYATYLAIGRITSLGFALLAVAFASWHAAATGLPPRLAKLGVAAVVAWSVLGASAVLEYYTPWTDLIFPVLALSLLVTIVLTAIYAARRARRQDPPPGTAWPLFAGAVAFIPLVIVFGHVPMGSYGFALAWLFVSPRMLRRNA